MAESSPKRSDNSFVETLVASDFGRNRARVITGTQNAPRFSGIFAKSSRINTRIAPESRLLNIESVFYIRRPIPEHTESRSGLRSHRTHEEVRADTRGMGESDERIVVDLNRGSTAVQLSVNVTRWAEENQCLVYQMTAEIVQQPARFLRGALLTPSAFWSRTPSLEP